MPFLPKPLRSLLTGRGDAPRAATAAPGGATRSSPLGGAAACEDVTVQHLWSDEPDALKFQLSRNVLPLGEQRAFESRADAADSPLAQSLFEVGGIEAVRLEGPYLTVRMDDNADWEGILQRLPVAIRKFFAAGGEPFATAQGTPGDGAGKRYKFGFKQVLSRDREEQMRIVQELFDSEVNPAVAAHGGFFNLLDVKDNTVYVQLGGGCQGCGMANVTLRQGVEARLREVLPEMVALVDTTDHAAGTNPYYQAGKK